MTSELPDVSLTHTASPAGPLAWVGMQGIDLPVTVAEPGCRREVQARADVHVDLPAPLVKGIHMSRLYRLLDALGGGEPLSPAGLQVLLRAIVDSHRDCATRSARLRLNLDLLVRRPALVTAGLSGWRSYPVRVDSSLVGGEFGCRAQVTVAYSSVCPCSAALARQKLAEDFLDASGAQSQVEPAKMADWLQRHSTMAIPHSQRSEAQVEVSLAGDAQALGLIALIDCVEGAVSTAVQSAVKRADEQAFAVLNGRNLMFVEDAARRIDSALRGHNEPRVHVRHFESLHPHDAVAWVSR